MTAIMQGKATENEKWQISMSVDKNGRAVTNVIIAKCCERNDSLGHVVKARVESMCQSDLHAADARYHRACKTIFLYKCDKVNDNEPEDPSFLALADTLCFNRAKIWNSVELYQEYEENGGTIITDRYILIRKIKNHFKDAIIVLSSPESPALTHLRLKRLSYSKSRHCHFSAPR